MCDLGPRASGRNVRHHILTRAASLTRFPPSLAPSFPSLGPPFPPSSRSLPAGLGDFAGVFIGHTSAKMLLNALGYKVDVKKEVQTGLLLGSAAFCSGFCWQPVRAA